MKLLRVVIMLMGLLPAAQTKAEPGDPIRGQQVYRACLACHSLESNRNMTGPSLADLWGRKAGGLASFRRYSSALKSSDVVWDDRTLDPWLQDPQAFIPGNHMNFPGIKDATTRRVAEPVYGYKTLVEEETGRILGAHLLGPHASVG